jgi:DNA invertase Pin-like site-specific DNA recombinase
MSKVICYSRVSTGEQANSGLGLEAQQTRLASECAHLGG